MLSFSLLSAADKAEAVKSGNNVLDPRIQEIINKLVASLVARRGIPDHMSDDVAIELYLELYKVADKFDPSRCDFINYARMVVNRRAVDFVRNYRAKNRLRTIPLETPIDAKGHTLADTLPAVEDGENSLAEKIKTALQNMPDYLATICRDIMDGMSIKAILAKHHIPHSTFYRRDVPAIRRYLTESGISPNDNCGGAR